MCANESVAWVEGIMFYGINASSFLIANQVERWAHDGLYVRWLVGSRMEYKPALLDECAAALQFPWYFGSNWDAFDSMSRSTCGSSVVVAFVVMAIMIGNCVIIETDGSHPWWNVSTRTYTRTDHLTSGDQVLTADGTTLTATGVVRTLVEMPGTINGKSGVFQYFGVYP